MKVALVHDWLVAQRGGEQVLLELCRMFPDAPVFTLVYREGSIDAEIAAHRVQTSFVQELPLSPRRFRQYLPLFPLAAERFDLSGFDLVISTSHCVAKAVRTRPPQRHIAYIHTPMRYVWDQMGTYLSALPAPARPLARLGALPLRAWDRRTASRPTRLVANSHFVRRRIERVWGRAAAVVYPPVDVDFFADAAPGRERRGLLVVSALVPYKRVEMAVALANARALPLTVVGEGPERSRLQAMAGPTVRFLAGLQREALRDAYANAEALLFCGEEDFGMVPVEAMAAGCPVVAYASGGAIESVGDDDPRRAGGVLYPWPTLDSLASGLDTLLVERAKGGISSEQLLAKARRFDRATFMTRFGALLDARP